ncbi:MAG: M23 family metallopeptidase [Anaerolineae bacterium]|nr:M23 family metallopeptidase [Anaerolineae bacterium]
MLKNLVTRLRRLSWWKKGLIALAGVIGTGICGVITLVLYSQSQSDSNKYINRWFDDPASRPELTTIQREPCPGAPFLLPSDGLIGLLWRDSALPYNIFKRHTGVDIFGDGEPGEVPVYAAYDGYLTRLPDWKATVIIRHDDPLEPGRTIWTYYTHMASRDGDTSYIADSFPAGTREVWVTQGTLLGTQGEYSGGSLAPVGLHLHFSIVKSDPDGSFKNESRLGNTLDPSPYFGMGVNIAGKPARPIMCQ